MDLYRPTPREAKQGRAIRVFQADVGLATAPVSGTAYRSPMLDVKGYELVNAFVSIFIREDPAFAPGVGLPLIAGLVVASQSGGSTVVITSNIGQAEYAGPGFYTFPLLATSRGLGSTARFQLQGDGGRRPVAYTLDGVLCAGKGI